MIHNPNLIFNNFMHNFRDTTLMSRDKSKKRQLKRALCGE